MKYYVKYISELKICPFYLLVMMSRGQYWMLIKHENHMLLHVLLTYIGPEAMKTFFMLNSTEHRISNADNS